MSAELHGKSDTVCLTDDSWVCVVCLFVCLKHPSYVPTLSWVLWNVLNNCWWIILQVAFNSINIKGGGHQILPGNEVASFSPRRYLMAIWNCGAQPAVKSLVDMAICCCRRGSKGCADRDPLPYCWSHHPHHFLQHPTAAYGGPAAAAPFPKWDLACNEHCSPDLAWDMEWIWLFWCKYTYSHLLDFGVVATSRKSRCRRLLGRGTLGSLSPAPLDSWVWKDWVEKAGSTHIQVNSATNVSYKTNRWETHGPQSPRFSKVLKICLAGQGWIQAHASTSITLGLACICVLTCPAEAKT